jgi:hypothetical protein
MLEIVRHPQKFPFLPVEHTAHISRVPVILPVPVIYRFVSVKTIEIQRLFSQVSDICRGADIPDQVAGIITSVTVPVSNGLVSSLLHPPVVIMNTAKTRNKKS